MSKSAEYESGPVCSRPVWPGQVRIRCVLLTLTNCWPTCTAATPSSGRCSAGERVTGNGPAVSGSAAGVRVEAGLQTVAGAVDLKRRRVLTALTRETCESLVYLFYFLKFILLLFVAV